RNDALTFGKKWGISSYKITTVWTEVYVLDNLIGVERDQKFAALCVPNSGRLALDSNDMLAIRAELDSVFGLTAYLYGTDKLPCLRIPHVSRFVVARDRNESSAVGTKLSVPSFIDV